MMQTDLFKQLDLNIDAATRIYWWQHPVAQMVLVGVLLIVVMGIIVWHRRRQQIKTDTLVQQLIDVLHESAEGDTLLAISAVLKRYTAWLVNDASICGMTDQEWLVYIKNVASFNTIIADCEQLVLVLDRYKFAGQTPERTQIAMLLESAYAIMAKTSAGRIPEHTGCFAARLKRD